MFESSTMRQLSMQQSSSTIEAISNLLFIDAKVQKVDLIFVFGTDWMPTMDEVARLYKDGVAPTILITGHSVDKQGKISEAQKFMERGLELGIPREKMFTEEQATNTKESVIFCTHN